VRISFGDVRARRRGASAVVVALLFSAIALGAACGGDGEGDSAASSDASADRVSAAPHVKGDAASGDASSPFDAGSSACNVRVEAPPVAESPHVPEGTAVVYATNPPSSGPHYPVWAHFQEMAQPVDDGYLVHSMEHGAVVLFYDCAALPADAGDVAGDADADADADAGGACAQMVAALRSVRAAIPSDPLCDPATRVRVILAPRPANDVAVAAAAWGATYRADCVDAPSLTRFVIDHYAKAPENFCTQGQVF